MPPSPLIAVARRVEHGYVCRTTTIHGHRSPAFFTDNFFIYGHRGVRKCPQPQLCYDAPVGGGPDVSKQSYAPGGDYPEGWGAWQTRFFNSKRVVFLSFLLLFVFCDINRKRNITISTLYMGTIGEDPNRYNEGFSCNFLGNENNC